MPFNIFPQKRKDFGYYCQDICKILRVEISSLIVPGCIYHESTSDQTIMQKRFDPSQLPVGTILNPGFTDDTDNVFISEYISDFDYEKKTIHYRPSRPDEKVLVLAHEIRHVYQKKYLPELYRADVSTGDPSCNRILNPAEIDADGFALAYVLSARTPFDYADLPSIMDEAVFRASRDEGNRWFKALELAQKLKLKSVKNIESFKKYVSQV